MRAVILAAGKGKRMGELTEDKPKPLLLVRGKTFLEHIISTLPQDVDEVIVVIGYKGEQIRAFLGNNFLGKKITYVVNEHIDKGNAHSLLLTREHFKPKERFVLVYSDELPSKDEMAECLSHEWSWLVREVDDIGRFSFISISSSGKVVDVKEKPVYRLTRTVPSGVMVVNADIFDCAPKRHENGEYYITSMMEAFINEHAVKAITGTKNIYFSTPEDVDRFNANG